MAALLLAAKVVPDDPVFQNVDRGNGDVNLLKPPPHTHWNEGDGGRYIGTRDFVITRSPDDEAWTNPGPYQREHSPRSAPVRLHVAGNAWLDAPRCVLRKW